MGTRKESVTKKLNAWNKHGRFYLWVGTFMAVLTWFVFPPAGIVAVYCGYVLYFEEDRPVAGSAIGSAGAIGLILWIGAILFM